ncbi:MAG TPA: hypothetical protein DEA47_00755 [Peptococcaceae bacterium]|nr:hypothetical protein [Peptococcaceae bacterium]
MINSESSEPSLNQEHESEAIFKRERMGISDKPESGFNIDSSELIKGQFIFKQSGISLAG